MQKNLLFSLAILGTLTVGYFLLRNKLSGTVENILVQPTAMKDIYHQWKVEYNHNLGGAEDDYRFKVFSINYLHIMQHNKNPNKTYELGLNGFTHLTEEEFSAIFLGSTLPETFIEDDFTIGFTDLNITNLNASVDWRPIMNPAKTQGKCGSCWAFSAVAAIEGTYAVKAGVRLDLSEQELVDCSATHGNKGCHGGLKDRAFRYVIANGGLASQEDYPYKAVEGTCRSDFQRYGNISSYIIVPRMNPEALKAALNQQPVAVSVNAETWKNYRSGIINDEACNTKTNHAIIAVGYNTTDDIPYYIVRNSWGPKWGENGHARVAIKDGIGICGIHHTPYFPVI